MNIPIKVTGPLKGHALRMSEIGGAEGFAKRRQSWTLNIGEGRVLGKLDVRGQKKYLL